MKVAVVGEAVAAVAAAAAAAAAASGASTSAPALGETGEPDGNPATSGTGAGADEAEAGALDLALSEGGAGFSLSPVLGGDRRDGYRRTRHGKRRSRTGRAEGLEGLLQPKLFKK